ncbi:MAG: hypothetical protein ACRD0H_16110 [Actinomycetes bacterium]
MIFYTLSALIALFCLMALGFGPEVFAVAGAALAVWAFRRRRRSWWGLGLSAGGAVVAIGALSGLAGHDVVYSSVAVVVAVIVLRLVASQWVRMDPPPHAAGGRVRPGSGPEDY